MAGEGREGEESPGVGEDPAGGQKPGIPDELVAAAGDALVHPSQSPLYHAENAQRYERQALIRAYEGAHNCRLVVVFDMLFSYGVNLFEELVYDADPDQDLHLLLATPGGDGETAVRLARSAQARCKEFTVIVPDQAKSAGTILALGAHHVLMGPTSDLGPIDPQFQIGPAGQSGLVSAKDIIAAVEYAEVSIQANPETYTLHSALLSDVTALMVQQARSALDRSDDILVEALRSNPARSQEEVESLWTALRDPLIVNPKSHGAILSEIDADELGLPITMVDPRSDQWQLIWRLWMKYWSSNMRTFEGLTSSKVIGPWGVPG
jgi:hypothetical protein